jgi:Ribbon-helix-helix protein, copG family
MKARVNLTLEESNWKKLQHRALDERTSASEIIDQLIAEYLKKNPKKRGK